MDHPPPAAVTPITNVHPYLPFHCLVKPARRLIARIVDRVGDALRPYKRVSGPLFAKCPGIGGGREAGGALEQALKVRRRIACYDSKFLQRCPFARLDCFDCRQHRCLVARNVIGAAALAWPQPRLARIRSTGKEANVAARRMPCRAGREAKDTRGEHARDEAPVKPPGPPPPRSEERRVGKECASTWSTRGSPV